MNIDELEFAYEAVNFDGSSGEMRIYVSKTTGEIVWASEEITGEKCPVEDIEDNVDYIPIPNKYDLDVGQRLVWRFVDMHIPGLYDKVREIFSRKGAYSRYKQFLEYNGILEKWYDFENTQLREALSEWCEQNEIKLDTGPKTN